MPVAIPPQLMEIQQAVKAGAGQGDEGGPQVPVRMLLEWYKAHRRGGSTVSVIREHLRQLGLETVPDFADEYIEAPVRFVAAGSRPATPPPTAPTTDVPPHADAQPATGTKGEPAAGRPPSPSANSIRRLDAANLAAAGRALVSIAPDKPIAEAVTMMLAHDFSQLPVMQGERKVLGMFSWQSLGSRLALGVKCDKVADAMEPPEIVTRDAPLFQVATILLKRDAVLVKASEFDPKITGIVTTADLVLQFARTGGPFLLLGQIENHVRACIEGRFTQEELQAGKDPRDTERTVEGVADMSFGEYVRLLEEPGRWSRCMEGIDRGAFIAMLKRVGRIRNEVMHFDPEGIEPDDHDHLRTFALFLDRIAKLKGQGVNGG